MNNLETINKWLDEEYGCSYTKLEELHDYYFEKYTDQKEEMKKLRIQISAREEIINKAIEYIKKEEKANPDSNRKDIGLILINYKRVLNILNGVDKE